MLGLIVAEQTDGKIKAVFFKLNFVDMNQTLYPLVNHSVQHRSNVRPVNNAYGRLLLPSLAFSLYIEI